MISSYEFLLLLLRILLVCGQSLREQKFAMEPQDQTAVVGSRVTLPCRVINKSGILQWTKDDFGLGTHRNLSGFERYSMIGSDEEGDFSLDIYPVMLDDDARYQCQVSPGPLGQPGIRSRFATLTVLVQPQPPQIVQGDFLVTTEDREIELECVSVGGKPAAEITWIDGQGNVLTEGIEYLVEEVDGRRFTARSIVKLSPRKDHHNTSFTCQAQNTAERTHRSAKLKLEVKYAPKVTVSILSGASASGRIPEFSEVHVACQADANPSDVTYRWFLNDEPLVGDFTTELVIHNVTRKYHDSIVKCEVYNAVGKSEESETLDVTYGPQFRTRPQSVQADLGSSVTLTCDVDGNPPAEISWYSPRRQQIAHNSPNLTLTVDRGSSGRYTCKARVPNYPEVASDAFVYVKGPPSIVSHRTQFGLEGDNVRVECTAYSIPPPEKVQWWHGDKEVDLHDQDYSILEDPLPEGIKSTLVIRESQGRHFGVYNCSVTNAYGSDTVEINLMLQKSFPSLIVIIGVPVAIIILVIVVMIVVLCQRAGNAKKAPPEVDTNTMEKQCKESDRSSNISDLKLDLRTGSSNSNVHCDMEYTLRAGSETGSESIVTRIGVPLAGPVNLLSGAGAEQIYRYSNDYTEPTFPPKDGHNNNGYVPYVDYTRDYAPPSLHQHQSSQQPSLPPAIPLHDLPNGGATIDPRFSATYGNPYLRQQTSLPPPTPNTAIPGATPAPPPYSRLSSANGSVTQMARLPTTLSPTASTQYITVPNGGVTVAGVALVNKRGATTLATHV